MLVVTRYRVASDDERSFVADADAAVGVLGDRPGFVEAVLGHNADDPELWTLTMRWHDVGSYRRALSSYDVKVTAVPLLSRAVDEPSAYVVERSWGAEAFGHPDRR